MEKSPLTGSRIRTYRVERGLKQADLASLCQISPSYLNLIEHNRRNIGGALLVRIARALEVDSAYLSGMAEVRLAGEMDAAADANTDVSPERSKAEELATRFPGWARLISRQHAEIRRLEQVIERLGDRLTHDPFLSASMHNVLTSVTAIRSASAILAQGGDIEPEWEARFHRNIFEDSQRLTGAAEELVSYLDNEADGEASDGLPQDDVDRWLSSFGWRVDAVETDPTADIDAIIAGSNLLKSEAARALARTYLARYAEDAKAIPLEMVVTALAGGESPSAIAMRAGASLPLVYRRLAVLHADETPDGETFGLVSCDASGTLMFRKSLPGFDLPRYSAGCPFWPLFTALQRPMMPVHANLNVAGRDDARFAVQAFSEMRHPNGFDGPAVTEAWMLFQARLGNAGPATRVGTSCRICPERDCVARREPSVFVMETPGVAEA